MSQVLILGGGVSGLAAAYFLSLKGISVTLVEQESRTGGLIRTDNYENCLLEAGPDSYIATKPELTELAESIPELHGQIIGTNDRDRRIFSGKRRRANSHAHGHDDDGAGRHAGGAWVPLFSQDTRARILQERFFQPKTRTGDVSIAEFVTEHFDSTLLAYIAEPLLTGVYGGDVAKLSVRSVLPKFWDWEQRQGSLVRAVRAEMKKPKRSGSLFLSFRNGMQSVTDALRHAVMTRTRFVTAEATAVLRNRNGWQVKADSANEEAESLIVALPAHRAAQIFSDSRAELSDELAAIPYSSSISVVVVYPENRIGHPLDGFGILVPRPERRGVAACTFIHRKFPTRIASGLAAIRAFIVDKDADKLLSAPDTEVIALVRSELNRLLGIEAVPLHVGVQRWPRSMPQYIVGHQDRTARIVGLARQFPNLYLAGNAYDGVGIPDCVRLAGNAARAISASLTGETPAPLPVRSGSPR